MAINIKPLGDRLIVEPIEREETIAGGLLLPETAKEKPQQAEVIALGSGKRDKDGKVIAFEVKAGDRVLISTYGGTEVKLNDEDYLLLREDDILGIIA